MNVISDVLQVICVLLVLSGLAYEFHAGADAGYVLITLGSVLFALSTKVRKYYMIKDYEYKLKKMEEKKDA